MICKEDTIQNSNRRSEPFVQKNNYQKQFFSTEKTMENIVVGTHSEKWSKKCSTEI